MAFKKWATKKEINDLLRSYCVRQNEFEPFGDEGYSFKSSFVKGYVISIGPEIQHGNVETGRIIVYHTKSNGKRTFQDVWERDTDGKLQFVFRNPWDKAFTDYDYIQDLEAQIRSFKEASMKMITKEVIDEMSNKEEHRFEGSKDQMGRENERIALLESENQTLREKVLSLEKENQRLLNKTGHNARGAGRKADPQHLKEQVDKVQSLIEEDKDISEILQIMGISRSSYFRYKKFIKNI